MFKIEILPGDWGVTSCFGRAITVVASSCVRIESSVSLDAGTRGEWWGQFPKRGMCYLSSLLQGSSKLLRSVTCWRHLYREWLVPPNFVQLRNLGMKQDDWFNSLKSLWPFNQSTLNDNTSELPGGKRKQASCCCHEIVAMVHLTVLEWLDASPGASIQGHPQVLFSSTCLEMPQILVSN